MNLKSIGQIILIVFILQCLFGESVGKTFEEDLTITLDEKHILDKFRQRVESRLPHEYMKEDIYLVRWLRARNFDLHEAEVMLMDNLRWRKEKNMDTVQEEDWSDYFRNYQYSLGEGRDKDWKPLIYLNVGSWDFRNAAISGKTEKFMRYIDKIIDEFSIFARNDGNKYKNVTQVVLMINMKGFNLVEQGCLQCVPIILRIIVTYETHFPGLADKIILINTPGVADAVVQAARLVFHPITNKSFFVFRTNKKEWSAYLSKYFEWDQLPYDIGGTKVFSYMEEDYF